MAAQKRSRVSKKTQTQMNRTGLGGKTKKGSKATKKKCATAAAKVRGSKNKGVRSVNRGVIASDKCKTGTKKKGNPKYKVKYIHDKNGKRRKMYVLKKKN